MKTLIGLLIAACAMPVYAQAPKTKTGQLLWSVQGKQNTVYLLGSLHVFKKEDYPMPAPLAEAYAASKKVVFETDMGKLQAPEMQAIIMKLGLYPPGETLDKHMKPETMKRLRDYFKQTGMLEQQFISMRPWLLGLTLSVMEIMRQGYQVDLGIDQHFYKQAIRDKKPTQGMEPVEFQMKLLSGLAEGDQEKFLNKTLDDMKDIKQEMEKMRTAWKTGDDKAMARLIIDGFKDHPNLYKNLLVERNKNWIPQIEKMLGEKDDVLVVVGSGHLVGKDSVVKMLEQKGWKAER